MLNFGFWPLLPFLQPWNKDATTCPRTWQCELEEWRPTIVRVRDGLSYPFPTKVHFFPFNTYIQHTPPSSPTHWKPKERVFNASEPAKMPWNTKDTSLWACFLCLKGIHCTHDMTGQQWGHETWQQTQDVMVHCFFFIYYMCFTTNNPAPLERAFDVSESAKTPQNMKELSGNRNLALSVFGCFWLSLAGDKKKTVINSKNIKWKKNELFLGMGMTAHPFLPLWVPAPVRIWKCND